MDSLVLRGSGELLHLIKEKKVSLDEVAAFCQIVWNTNSKTCESPNLYSDEILGKLVECGLIRVIDSATLMANPHVVAIGNAVRRGELRHKFKGLASVLPSR